MHSAGPHGPAPQHGQGHGGQFGGEQHPAPPPGPRGRAPGIRMRGVGRLLFWIGGILTVVCVAGGVILAVSGFTRVAESASISHPVDGPTDIDLEAGERMMYYVPGVVDPSTAGSGHGSGYGSDDDSDPPDYVPAGAADCSATGPSVIDIRPGGTKHTTSSGGETRVSDGGFTAEDPGTYTVMCSPDAGVDVTLGPPTDVGGILSGIGGVLAAVFGALAFGAVTLLGLVLWLVGRDSMKKHAAL